MSVSDQAVALLQSGGIVALPTETVYGLAAAADDELAVRRVYRVKGRPAEHPLIVHLPAQADLALYAAGALSTLQRLAERFWPGPLTVIVAKTRRVSDLVTAGQPGVALRMVDHPLTLEILARLGNAVAMPSANRFGRVSPTTAGHVLADLGSDVDLIVDGGPARIGVESTILDLTGDIPAILRAGAIGPAELGETLNRPVVTRVGGAVRAPGMLAAHYAPRVPLILIEAPEFAREVARRSADGQRIGVLTLPANAQAAAYALYATMRDLDSAAHDVILAILPPDTVPFAAVRDRLIRAAAASRA